MVYGVARDCAVNQKKLSEPEPSLAAIWTVPATLVTVGLSLPFVALAHVKVVGSTTCMSNAIGCQVVPSHAQCLLFTSLA